MGGEVGAIGDILNKTKKQWEISGEETKELIEIRGKVKKRRKEAEVIKSCSLPS